METKYFPKGVLIKTLEAALEEAARQDVKFVYGLEAAIQILRNAEPLDFAEAMSRATPKKPILRNSDQYQCELNVCPTCGHIVEGEQTGEPFAYCPGCGQRIDWDGAAKDASVGTEGGAAP